MTPDELDRELARLTRLAEAARQRLDDLAEQMNAVRLLMDDLGASPASSGGDEAPGEARTSKRTTDEEVAQVEVVSK